MIGGAPQWSFALGAAAVMLLTAAALVIPRPQRVARAYSTFDLLRVPWIGGPLHWRPLRPIAQGTFVALFLLVIATGLFGRQQGGANAATILTWTYWWILLVLFVMLFGKLWCYVCPWDAAAGWLERLSLTRRTPRLSANLKWPRALRNLYPAAILFLALTWLELGYGVTTRPEWTALLGLLMFLLSLGSVLLFERRSFCRYGCLVGRISGLYALFAPLELRARDMDVCRTTCRTRDCYHGNANGDPCPTSQYLGSMTKNTYCILCGECLFTCPHRNVALNVRPFAQDLVKSSPVRRDEAALVVIMLAMSAFHGITMTPVWNASVRQVEALLGVPYLIAFTLGMSAFLAAIALAYFACVGLSFALARPPGVTFRQLAIRYAYAFLPVALFYHLAHNSMHFFVEGGGILPVLSDPFGWRWDLFGTAGAAVGPLLSLPAIWTMMIALVAIGQVWSLAVARRISIDVFPQSGHYLKGQLPMMAGMMAYSLLSLWIIAQPMEMRTGL